MFYEVKDPEYKKSMFEEESDIESWIENNQALNQIFSNDNYEEDEEDLFKVKDLNE